MKELMIPETENLERIDTLVTEYLSVNIEGKLSKALVVGNAIATLDRLITKDLMKPIMSLQGSKLGFRTDKDRSGGYPENIVKRCFVEALLVGVEPAGNQFNIIAGNMYITKEGCTHLLLNIPDLSYSVIPSIPKVIKNSDGEFGAICKLKVVWTHKHNDHEQELEFACKGATDKNGKHITSADAYNGKAERKAKHWLYCNVTGQNVSEGDAADAIDVEFSDIDAPKSPPPPMQKKTMPRDPADQLVKSDKEKSRRAIESSFHFMLEDIGKDKLSAYIGKALNTTLINVQRNPSMMEGLLNNKEKVKSDAFDLWDNQSVEL